MSIARIDRFAVPPSEDTAFLTEWDAAGGAGVLHRAIRPDAPVRFVAVGGDTGDRYELLRELGDPDEPDGVVLIARWPAGSSDDLVVAWDAQRAVLAARRGHIGARLYRGEHDHVEVAHWSSPLMLQRAGQDRGVPSLPGRLDAALYQVVRR